MKVISSLIKSNSKLFVAAIILVIVMVGLLFFLSMRGQKVKSMENLLPVVDRSYNRDYVVEWLEEYYFTDSEEINLIEKERYLVCDRKSTKITKDATIWSMPDQYGIKLGTVKKGEKVSVLLKDSRFDIFKIQAVEISGWISSENLEDPFCFSFNEILSDDLEL